MSDIEEASDTLAELNLDDTHKPLTENLDCDPNSSHQDIVVTIGATVPTGFELTAADEVKEKLGSQSRISKDRGKIYFDISVENLAQVCTFCSLGNFCRLGVYFFFSFTLSWVWPSGLSKYTFFL